jgi:hypothetical protein
MAFVSDSVDFVRRAALASLGVLSSAVQVNDIDGGVKVQAETSSGTQLIITATEGVLMGKTHTASGTSAAIAFTFADRGKGQRFAKTLEHAIRLRGGISPPF